MNRYAIKEPEGEWREAPAFVTREEAWEYLSEYFLYTKEELLNKGWDVHEIVLDYQDETQAGLLKKLASQALVIMQLDLGYSAERPPTYGHHAIRHQFLWDWAMAHVDELPAVNRERDGSLFNEPIQEALKENDNGQNA